MRYMFPTHHHLVLLPQAIARVRNGMYGSIEVLACLVLAEHEVDGQLAVSVNEDFLVLLDEQFFFNVSQAIPGSPDFCHIVCHSGLGICVAESFPT